MSGASKGRMQMYKGECRKMDVNLDCTVAGHRSSHMIQLASQYPLLAVADKTAITVSPIPASRKETFEFS